MRKKGSKAVVQNADSISLNKYISDTGFCSRREADNYINQGRVTINERPAILGNRVSDTDVVEVDGEPIKKKIKTVYIACNKPVGVTCTTDRKDPDNIVDYLRHPQRIFPVGRLDKDSDGLIFLTNDGNIVNKILRAGNNHEKEYIVVVDQPITKEFIDKMGNGVPILNTITQKCKVVQEGKSAFRITLIQGLNRQIRRMCLALNYKVVHLKRVRVMNVHLGNLPSGHWRYLTPEEIGLINKMVADSSHTEEASKPKPKPAPVKAIVQQEETAAPAAKKATTGRKESVRPVPPKRVTSYKDFRVKGVKKKKG